MFAIKVRLTVLVLLVLIAFTGCFAKQSPNIKPEPRLEYARLGAQAAKADFTVLSERTNVKLGEDAAVTISGVPGTTYYISSTFLQGRKMVTAMENRVAPANGIVSFTWHISGDTTPGTYPIVISGGGSTIRTKYTVSR